MYNNGNKFNLINNNFREITNNKNNQPYKINNILSMNNISQNLRT